MTILLRQVTIADDQAPHPEGPSDILIEDGLIKGIGRNGGSEKADIVLDRPGLIASSGWVDPFADFCDPGEEFRESVESGAKAAAAGGYTRVFVLPNTKPAVSHKTQVAYLIEKAAASPVVLHPIGAITKETEGKELSEMYDMHDRGALAFGDGIKPVQSPGLLLKALQYVRAFDGTVIQLPMDGSIGKGGLMHEGLVSTRLGLPGIPAIAEELMVQRDIDLLKYTGSRLHLTGISTARSLALIRNARQEGCQVSCSVSPAHLLFCDDDLTGYDTNLKLNPPLRTREDMLALRQGVIDGDVDCIASHHLPQAWDDKNCEFEYAKPGIISLQAAYAMTRTALPTLTPGAVARLFSTNARRIFNLPLSGIREGHPAEISLFDPNGMTTLTRENNQSRSFNFPLFGSGLNGKVIGTVSKGNLHLNP